MKKTIAIAGIIIGIIFILVGFNLGDVSSYIYSPEQYVGGDAYNYIIEASLRGGRIAGSAVYLVGGVVTTLISSFILSNELPKKTTPHLNKVSSEEAPNSNEIK